MTLHPASCWARRRKLRLIVQGCHLLDKPPAHLGRGWLYMRCCLTQYSKSSRRRRLLPVSSGGMGTWPAPTQLNSAG